MMTLDHRTKTAVNLINGRPEKMRSVKEITANYNLKLQQYHDIFRKPANSETQKQKLLLYSEVKILGWVLGKSESQVYTDAHN